MVGRPRPRRTKVESQLGMNADSDPGPLVQEQPALVPFEDAVVEDDLLRRSASVAGGDHGEEYEEQADPLDQLLEAYHFHFEPELRLKIKQR